MLTPMIVESNNRIQVLPQHVANKIAAGEVVDRPGSALKELMENAIDAGATELDVTITAGGKKLLSIADNGIGMDRDNALLAIERHATSKIRDVDDIEHIRTLGFRGEALAAIASVSRFRMQTRRRDDECGTELRIGSGKLLDVSDVGCPAGTLIEVRDLFFNVPARRKFLRGHQTELHHVRDTFIVQALSHPHVAMSLTVDGQSMYRLGAAPEVADRIRDLFGRTSMDRLAPACFDSGDVRLTGFVSRPDHTRADRTEQYLFVNGRPIAAGQLGYAIREGYRNTLPKGRHPYVFLFVETSPDLVDVNVHPKKSEVRFRHPNQVRDATIQAILDALNISRSATDQTPADPAPDPTFVPQPLPPTEQPLPIQDLPPTKAFTFPKLGTPRPQPPPPTQPTPQQPTTPHRPPQPPPTPIADAPWEWCRVLGQIGDLYVVMETEAGMVMMDPRAAHERILFDKLMVAALAGNVPTQNLLIPQTVALTHRDAARVEKQLGLLQDMGFGVAAFGQDTFVVDALPACLSDSPVEPILTGMAAALEEGGNRGTQHWREELLAEAACRAAVSSRKQLSMQEIERLVVDLAQCDMPYTSPRGRPTLIMTSHTELKRKFGRT